MLGMDFARAIIEKKQDKSLQRWRCLVCGHIHVGAEPPAVCPACGVGAENFVRESMEDEFINDTQDKFVIVGGGSAALSAAQAIRKRNRTASILMLTEEEYRPYYRPALSDLLSEDLPDDRLYVFDSAWYEDNRVELRTKTRVEKIEPDQKVVVTGEGREHPLHQIDLCCRGLQQHPAFQRAGKPRSLQPAQPVDALILKEAIKAARKAVVIGGGVLGLEAVWEMVPVVLRWRWWNTARA